MKTEKNILIAFLLNFSFSIFEFFGGTLTGSVAIISDALHDLGDAVTIGISYFLEKKSKKPASENFTYGYLRYSLLGGLITTSILLIGSFFVILSSIKRFFSPIPINYNGMIVFSIVGVLVNFLAVFLTHEKESLNQKAVNLHMTEDLLGWIVVLIGAVVMRFTNFFRLDSVLSFSVGLFIFITAIKNINDIIDIFCDKVPNNIDIVKVKEELLKTEGILDVHHIHIWSMDGKNNYATMHIVANDNFSLLKKEIRHKLHHLGINHVTLEFEKSDELCSEKLCNIEHISLHRHSHHTH